MAATTSSRTSPTPPPARGIGWAGIALVLVVVAIISLNTTAKFLATEPVAVWLGALADALVDHGILGFAILGAVVWTRRRVPAPGMRQYVAVGLAVVAATVAVLLGFDVASDDEPFDVSTFDFGGFGLAFGTDVVRYSFVGIVIASAWLYLCAEAEHAAAAAQVSIDAERMDRETAEARLQMLEAQIEPHFLFNTLAHVRRLYETDHEAGVRMLRDLKDYLSNALPRMREGAATVGREIDHVIAYLGIQQIRMGRRLAFAIDVPEALRDARLPSLMLLTLVENAVKHGLTPLPEGGRIVVRGTAIGERLRIDVADTGRGFVKTQGGGTGLANIRARLASTYGPSASLGLALNQPAGVIATLELPLETGEPAISPS